ncbi:hypothetical protein F4055_09000 [Candidatus Poribacteria bacterium]|nr:hypothetical protein [Candidatus Poribacteria bacterium]
MANHFNDLLLETLKEIRVRLDRLEGRADRLIEQKTDKSDFEVLRSDFASLSEKLDQKTDKSDFNALRSDFEVLRADVAALSAKLDQKTDKSDFQALTEEVHANGQRLDRIEAGIKTLQWTMTAGIAVMGLALALFKAC